MRVIGIGRIIGISVVSSGVCIIGICVAIISSSVFSSGLLLSNGLGLRPLLSEHSRRDLGSRLEPVQGSLGEAIACEGGVVGNGVVQLKGYNDYEMS